MSRHVMRIELSGDAKSKLTELSDRTGMTQVAIMSRLVTTFAKQPEAVQAGMLGKLPAVLEPTLNIVVNGNRHTIEC